jgi:hypothetical protein
VVVGWTALEVIAEVTAMMQSVAADVPRQPNLNIDPLRLVALNRDCYCLSSSPYAYACSY